MVLHSRSVQIGNLFFAHFDLYVDNSPGRELPSFRYIRNAEKRQKLNGKTKNFKQFNTLWFSPLIFDL